MLNPNTAIRLGEEIDHLRAEINEQAREIECMRQQLATALAACEAKDHAIKSALFDHSLDFSVGDSSIIDLKEALSIKPDASTLKAHDEALIEKIASFIETQRNDIPACGFEFASAIRELKGTL